MNNTEIPEPPQQSPPEPRTGKRLHRPTHSKATHWVHKWLNREKILIHVLYAWFLWEVKRAATIIHGAVAPRRFRLLFKLRNRKWWFVFKLWEYKNMLGELLALQGWRLKALNWHIKNRSKRGMMALEESRDTARRSLKHSKGELATHLGLPEWRVRVYTTLFVCWAICSMDINQAEKEVMVPFQVYAWVYGYWSCLHEEWEKSKVKKGTAGEQSTMG